ncbi:MAG: hypothetical protein B6U97_02470 [Candidatus Altiarchaeales archaeon ex4484_96]|nr:MAG: hypothetical protein B6U97_02470 [Candidatus Altiarchaeales archaeon ex4484_96]
MLYNSNNKLEINNKMDTDIILPGAILIMIIIFMVPFVRKKYIDVKQGYPPEDERSKCILTLASARAFTLSIWWMLALM